MKDLPDGEVVVSDGCRLVNREHERSPYGGRVDADYIQQPVTITLQAWVDNTIQFTKLIY